MAERPRIALFGNCQARATGTLLGLTLPEDSYEISTLSSDPRNGPMLGADEIVSHLAGADYVFYQRLHERHGDLSASSIAAACASAKAVISIPRIANFGVSGLSRRPNDERHDYGYIYGQDAIEELIDSGLGRKQILRRYIRGEIDLRPARRQAECIVELRRREIETDVRVADFIEENYRDQRLFLTMHHPSTALFLETVRQLDQMTDLPIDLTKIDPAADDNLARLPSRRAPISPHDVAAMGYRFPPEPRWRAMGRKLIHLICDAREPAAGMR